MSASPRERTRQLLLGLIAGGLALQLHLAFRVNISWDEFYFLGAVHELARGELWRPLQSFHARLFGWLTWLPDDEILQMLTGRVVAWGAEVLALAGVFTIARRFVGASAALFSVLTLLSSGYVLQHGASFRADPFVVALGIWSMALCLTAGKRQRARTILGGALFALAVLLSIKSLFYLVPVIAALTLVAQRRPVARLAEFAAGLAPVFGGLLFWHLSGLAEAPAAAASRGAQQFSLAELAKSMLLPPSLPGWQFLATSLRQEPLVWAGLIGGGACLAERLRRPVGRREALLALALASPLATLLFYRNAFPYFYLFALAPAALLAGIFFEWTGRWVARRSRRVVTITLTSLSLAASLTLFTQYSLRASDEIAPQRALLDAVHQVFPQPVPYIDRCSMVATFPKVGLSMTSLRMETYQRAGEPVLERVLVESAPPLLLANSPGLVLSLPEALASSTPYALLAEDRRILRENFVHHWGWIWVAGKELRFAEGSAEINFEILIPGRYTLESVRSVVLDGAELEPGETIELSRGRHRVEAARGGDLLRLRWGRRLYRPEPPPYLEFPFSAF